MHEGLVNHLGGLSLPRKSVVRLTDHPDMTLDVYRGHKTTTTTKHVKMAVDGDSGQQNQLGHVPLTIYRCSISYQYWYKA